MFVGYKDSEKTSDALRSDMLEKNVEVKEGGKTMVK